MKVALIGSGAAALGVLDRLAATDGTARPEVTLIDRPAPEIAPAPVAGAWTDAAIARLYRDMKPRLGAAFPPPKTRFGAAPGKREVPDWGWVWDSAGAGGLTSIWGLSAVPFSRRDMRGWPIGPDDLRPHYSAIAARIGISGRADAFGEAVGDAYSSLPPIPVPPVVDALRLSIDARPHGESYDFVAGASRLALETRPERPNGCIACGECMLGCPRDSMHSSATTITSWAAEGLVTKRVPARALAVDLAARTVAVAGSRGERESLGPFDRIYIAAGCIGSTEIAMRSLGLHEGPLIVDSAVYTLVIAYLGPSRPWDARRYVALTNLLIAAIPRAGDGPSAQVQIYPIFDHLWRYYLPRGAWPFARPIGKAMRRRMLLARVFLDDAPSQRYAIHVAGDAPARLTLAHPGTALADIPGLLPDLKRLFNGGRFRILPLPITRQRTSSHYAASLPMQRGPVGLDGAIAPGIHLCDSATFPTAPATSPTFTIMANARRIADASLR